jgi:hypothetical protein
VHSRLVIALRALPKCVTQAAEEPASAYDWFLPRIPTASSGSLRSSGAYSIPMRPHLDPRAQPTYWGNMLRATPHWRRGTGPAGGRLVDADYQGEGCHSAIGMLYLMSCVHSGCLHTGRSLTCVSRKFALAARLAMSGTDSRARCRTRTTTCLSGPGSKTTCPERRSLMTLPAFTTRSGTAGSPHGRRASSAGTPSSFTT